MNSHFCEVQSGSYSVLTETAQLGHLSNMPGPTGHYELCHIKLKIIIASIKIMVINHNFFRTNQATTQTGRAGKTSLHIVSNDFQKKSKSTKVRPQTIPHEAGVCEASKFSLTCSPSDSTNSTSIVFSSSSEDKSVHRRIGPKKRRSKYSLVQRR